MSKKDATISRDGLKVSENVLKLADAIKKDLKIGTAGVVEDPGKDFFERHLPENISLADVKRVDSFRSDLLAAATLALGEVAVPYFQKDKEAQQVSLQFGLNKDKASIQIDRERKYPNRMGGKDAPDIVYNCNPNVSYRMAAASSTGEYKRVRDHLRSEAAKIFQ
jgi:hypothetical protein